HSHCPRSAHRWRAGIYRRRYARARPYQSPGVVMEKNENAKAPGVEAKAPGADAKVPAVVECSQPIIWVAESAQLRTLCEQWLKLPWLALDTEFMRTDTFYPVPALVQ